MQDRHVTLFCSKIGQKGKYASGSNRTGCFANPPPANIWLEHFVTCSSSYCNSPPVAVFSSSGWGARTITRES